MTALEILEEYKKPVWKEIKKHLVSTGYPEVFKIPYRFKDYEKIHWNAVREYPKRKGKYFRPTLVMLTAEAMGAKRQEAVKTAASMQTSEDWILIHDDVEDDSIKRRGKPALHKIFGEEIAINAGDALHTIMWRMVFESQKSLGEKKTREIISEFNKILERTVMGQTSELIMTRKGKINISQDEYFFIVDSKTAYYTIAGPMRLGAIIAGAGSEKLAKIAQFGVYLGRCFQLVDDILDVTTDFSGLKEKGGDIYEGKRTLLVSHLWQNLNAKDKKRLVKIIGSKREDKTKREVDWVMRMMQGGGTIEYTKHLAEEYKEKALEYLGGELGFISGQPAREKLETLLKFVLERDR